MIIQLTSTQAINTDWIEYIESGNEAGETYIHIRGGQYMSRIEINVPIEEVMRIINSHQ